MTDPTQSSDSMLKTPPPSGDAQKAEKYLNRLVELINQDKLVVKVTDLSKFDPSTLEKHYSIDLNDYQVEISHSKHPENGEDSYVLIFNNLKQFSQDNHCQKIILAYMYMSHNQFSKFQMIANAQIEKIKKHEEEKRLTAALEPIDQILDSLDHDQDNKTDFYDDIIREDKPHHSANSQIPVIAQA